MSEQAENKLPTGKVRDELYRQLGSLGSALSSPVRLHLLSLLSHGPKSVARLAEVSGHQMANVSAHLKVLREAGLVKSSRDGKYVFYSLSTPRARELVGNLRTLAETAIPEVRELLRTYYREDVESVARIGLEALKEEVESGEVILLDLRPDDEFGHGHIPGARSVPFPELDKHLDSLRKSDKPIYAYCRGRYCVMASQGTARLRDHGLPAQRLPFSIHAWTDKGWSLVQ
jgi:DNA-binding transcriptional ArsR family regulator/rhodanese-related sulfurtransferase